MDQPKEIRNLPTMKPERKRGRWRVLSMVLVGLLLIGVTAFLAMPNVISVYGTEENYSITRAEALNMATAAFIQSRGRENANAEWEATTSGQERYELLRPFLAFAPAEFSKYMPEGYAVMLPNNLQNLSKVPLVQGVEIGY